MDEKPDREKEIDDARIEMQKKAQDMAMTALRMVPEEDLLKSLDMVKGELERRGKQVVVFITDK